jgi:hypothetical protein
MNEGLFIVIFFMGFIVLGFIAYGIGEAIVLIDKLKKKKLRKKYPELFILIDDVCDFGHESCSRHNATVPKLIKEIDRIQEELKYLPQWQVEIKNKKLEELRQELYEAKLASKADSEELNKKRKIVSEYVEKNNLKFAKKWGW